MNAVCPQSASGGRWTIGVSPKDIQLLQSNGHITKLARLGLVKEVAEDPAIIVQGWDRPDQEQCFVYVGYPDKDFRSGTIETPSLAPVNCCFLVFVLPDGTISDWSWRGVGDDQFPEGLERNIVWQPSTKT